MTPKRVGRAVKPLLLIKLALVRFGFGAKLVEFCDECGRTTDLVWWAPDELWVRITGERHGGGVRCVGCFDKSCYARGLILRWRPEVAHVRDAGGAWS